MTAAPPHCRISIADFRLNCPSRRAAFCKSEILNLQSEISYFVRAHAELRYGIGLS